MLVDFDKAEEEDKGFEESELTMLNLIDDPTFRPSLMPPGWLHFFQIPPEYYCSVLGVTHDDNN